MLKVALLAAAVGLAASAATATNSSLAPDAPAVDTPCRPGQTLELDCALRVADANGGATASPSELANLAAPAAPVLDWPPLRPSSSGLAFKDAATDTVSVLPATLDRDHSHPPLAPALLALGALVILLRRRPY